MTRKSDVLVLGGGVIGLASAYYLAKKGCKVTILEKDAIGKACSHKNAGLVVPSHIVPLAAPGVVAQGFKWLFSPTSPFYIRPRFDAQLISWLWKFQRACKAQKMRESAAVLNQLLQKSYQSFEILSSAQELDFEFQKQGLLLLYKSKSALLHDMEEVELARELGLQVSVLDESGIEELEPDCEIIAAGGIYHHQDGHLCPEDFITAMQNGLDALSVQIETGMEVIGFSTSGKKIDRVITDKDDYTADQIILAGGSWSPVLSSHLNLSLAVQAGKGYSVTFDHTGKTPAVPSILVEERVAVTPLGNTLRVSGTLELSGLNLTVNRQRAEGILQAVPDYYPGIEIPQVQDPEIWVGLRPCTPDGLPLIGRLPQYSNLLVATGHAMLGVTLAPVTGELVAGLVFDESTSIDMEKLSPVRF